MIYHIFQINSKAYELNLKIVESFIQLNNHFDEERITPFIILVEYYKEFTHHYFDLFKRYNFIDYVVIDNSDLSNIINIINLNSCILLHGPTYKFIFRIFKLGYKKVNWVCWGKGARINFNNYKSIIATPLKYLLYHRFKYIASLLEADEMTLRKHYGLRNVEVLAYYSENSLLRSFALRDINNSKGLYTVYLGNNDYCVDDYSRILDKLIPYKGKIEIHCMASYGSPSMKEKIEQLKLKGLKLFGNCFFIDQMYLSYEDYVAYMNKADVYISGSKKQSGLGAIYTMLALGKKIYIAGDNYNHVKLHNYIVYNIDELDEQFYLSNPKSIIEHNRALFFNSESRNMQEWRNFLNLIVN